MVTLARLHALLASGAPFSALPGSGAPVRRLVVATIDSTSLRSRPDSLDYQRTTSTFVPWFAKRRRPVEQTAQR
jgi:steroid 5-alpha reductase family enzyme